MEFEFESMALLEIPYTEYLFLGFLKAFTSKLWVRIF